MNTYLITGVTGFLGSYLADALLARGDRVVGIGRRERGHLSGNAAGHPCFTLIRGDAASGLSRIRGKEIAGVFHCASRQPSAPDITYEEYYAGNVAPARAAALFARDAGARFMIYTSSTAVYGAASGDRVFDESTPVAPDTWYGLTKFDGEQVTSLTLGGSATRSVIVRFPSLYGKRHLGGVVHTYYQLAAAHADIELFGGGKALRSIIHADDAVRLLLKTAEASESFEPRTLFTAGSSDARTTMDIAKELVSLLGSRSLLVALDRGHPGNIVVSTDRIRRVLGSSPQDISSGLKRYVEEMRHEV